MTVNRKARVASTGELWSSGEVLAVIKSFYERSRACSSVGRNVSSFFRVNSGLRAECRISTLHGYTVSTWTE